LLNKNDIIELKIENMTNEGSGVGRHDGIAVFVPYTAPGDVIKARIVKTAARYCFGIIEEMISPSSLRGCDGCSAFGRCGSCSLRHIAYDEELKIKNGWVQDNMRRIGGLDVELPPALPSPKVDRYRNKAVYPIKLQNGNPVIGFFAKRSHRVVTCDDCLLHPEFFGDICDAVMEWITSCNVSIYDEVEHKGLVRSLFIRHAEAAGKAMAVIIANGSKLPHEQKLIDLIRAAAPCVSSIMLNVNTDKTNVLLGKESRLLWGDEFITDRLCGLDFSISPLSFYQVNRLGAEQLYNTAADFAELSGGETLIDLYCGAGTIGLSMAHKVKQLIGVEIVAPAVENAKQNAAQNGISNARFICADAADAALLLEKEGINPDVVIVDPPRKGCSRGLIDTIVRMAPDRVVMVSCDSATAARDTAIFDSLGYHPVKIQAADMFPRTNHIECVVKLCRKGE